MAKSDDDGKVMKLVKEMVNSLDDKYSRVLDASQYAAIQKFDLIGVGGEFLSKFALFSQVFQLCISSFACRTHVQDFALST